MMNRTDIILISTFTMLCIAAAAIFWSGPYYQFDDMIYTSSALGMLSGNFTLIPAFAEVLTIMSMAASFLIFGISPFTAVLPTLLSYIGIVLISFLCGKRLQGYTLGAISASLSLSSPFILPFTTRALPDITSAFSASLGIYLFIIAATSVNHSRKVLFASGLLMGMATGFKTTEGFMVLGIFIVAVLLYSAHERAKRFNAKPNKNQRSSAHRINVLYILAGAAVPIIIIAAYFYITSGNPFFNIVTDNNFLSGTAKTPGSSTLQENIISLMVSINPIYYLVPRMQPIYLYGPGEVMPLGAIALLAIAGAAISILKRKGLFILLSIIGLFCFFYLFFGSQSYSIYTFIAIKERYFTIDILPLSILAAYPISLLYRSISRRNKVGAYAAILSMLALIIILNMPVYNAYIYFNRMTAETNQAYLNAINVAASQADQVTLYLGIPHSHFRAPDIDLLTHDSPNIILIPIVKQICNPNATNPFLIEVYSNRSSSYGPETGTMVQSEVANWTNGCTISEIWSSTTQFAILGGNESLYSSVYKIGRAPA